MISLKRSSESLVVFAWMFFEEARNYQKEQGFSVWEEDIPGIENALDDVYDQTGYMIRENGFPIGYVRIGFNEDPRYDDAGDLWKADGPFATVQWLAFSDKARGRGLSKSAFLLIRERCLQEGVHVIHLDVPEDNLVIRHILDREGFECRGEIGEGSDVAYELEF